VASSIDYWSILRRGELFCPFLTFCVYGQDFSHILCSTYSVNQLDWYGLLVHLVTRTRKCLYIMVQCWESAYAIKVLQGEPNLGCFGCRFENIVYIVVCVLSFIMMANWNWKLFALWKVKLHVFPMRTHTIVTIITSLNSTRWGYMNYRPLAISIHGHILCKPLYPILCWNFKDFPPSLFGLTLPIFLQIYSISSSCSIFFGHIFNKSPAFYLQ